jgi:pimeloyl-ACP methyl ester carboxylesterase
MSRGQLGGAVVTSIVMCGVLALGTLGLGGVIARRAYRRASLPFQPRRGPVARPSVAGVELRDVSFEVTGDATSVLHGWYASSHNGAAVIFLHGSSSDRTGNLDEALLLMRDGFGVLLFDWPGHGESGGSVHYAAPERAALTAALSWVSAQQDVRAGAIGVFGFSIGGYIAAQVVPADARVAALVLAGTPTTLADVLHWQYRKFGPLSRWPAAYAFERQGVDLSFDVRDAVQALGGRPLLIVSAELDQVVPVEQARAVYRAAHDPKQLYVSRLAYHGAYVAHDPAIAPVLLEFFRRHLLAHH